MNIRALQTSNHIVAFSGRSSRLHKPLEVIETSAVNPPRYRCQLRQVLENQQSETSIGNSNSNSDSWRSLDNPLPQPPLLLLLSTKNLPRLAVKKTTSTDQGSQRFRPSFHP